MSSPSELITKATSEVEFVAGVRTRKPDSCMMTVSEPSIVVVSLKAESWGPAGAGAGAGTGGEPADEGVGAGAGALLEFGGGGG